MYTAVDSYACDGKVCPSLQVSLRAKVDLPPDDVYEILIAPDNAAVFKGIKVSHVISKCMSSGSVMPHVRVCSPEQPKAALVPAGRSYQGSSLR